MPADTPEALIAEVGKLHVECSRVSEDDPHQGCCTFCGEDWMPCTTIRLADALTTAKAERDRLAVQRDEAVVRAARAADSAGMHAQAADARREEMRASRDAIYESRQEERAKVRKLTDDLAEARAALTKADEGAETGTLVFGAVRIAYWVDRNRQLRFDGGARDRSRWERDGWTVIPGVEPRDVNPRDAEPAADIRRQARTDALEEARTITDEMVERGAQTLFDGEDDYGFPAYTWAQMLADGDESRADMWRADVRRVLVAAFAAPAPETKDA